MRELNDKQRENLATFYNNLALVLLTAGGVSPIFTGITNKFEFIIKFIVGLVSTAVFLQISLDFLK